MARIQHELFVVSIAIGHARNCPGVDHHAALRIAVFATHTLSMIEQLVGALKARL